MQKQIPTKTMQPFNHLILVLPVTESVETGPVLQGEDVEMTRGVVIDVGMTDTFYFPDGKEGKKSLLGIQENFEVLFNASNALPYYIDGVCHYIIGVMQIVAVVGNKN